LVQLQRDLKLIEDAGIRLVGISYDEPEALKRFADQMKITFPLLSDPGSRTIDAYHIRNEAAKGKAVGVPNPGTFILDRGGVIRAKLFLEGYRDRHTTAALIEAAKSIK
jgi:peroxiredoxin